MHRFIVRFIFLFALAGITTGSAQVSSEFYFPLRAGNNWTYHTGGVQNGWQARTTRETIDGTDLIAGQLYYRVKGVEILDDSPSDTTTFHVFWLRQDPGGNILMGAMSEVYTILDSAMRFDPPVPFFTNDHLIAGFSRTYFEPGKNVSVLDSVESTTETVNTSAGSFSNCLKIRDQHKDTLGTIVFLEHAWYARGVGEVKRTRTLPLDETHTNDMIQYSAVTSIEAGQTGVVPGGFVLQQNYPNPFNPQTVIRYALPHRAQIRLTVFNMNGQHVAELVNGEMGAGYHEVLFNASTLASGVYFYRLQADGFMETRSFLLLR